MCLVICGCFPGSLDAVFCSPRMVSKPNLRALAARLAPLIGALTDCTIPGHSGPGCNEGEG